MSSGLPLRTDIVALCYRDRHRFASLTTLLAAGPSAGPSDGRVSRVMASTLSRIEAA